MTCKDGLLTFENYTDFLLRTKRKVLDGVDFRKSRVIAVETRSTSPFFGPLVETKK